MNEWFIVPHHSTSSSGFVGVVVDIARSFLFLGLCAGVVFLDSDCSPYICRLLSLALISFSRCSITSISPSRLSLFFPSTSSPRAALTGSADARSYLHWSIGQETDQQPPPHLPLGDWAMTGARARCHFIHQTMTATCPAPWWDVTDL